jgi:adenine phosphoribosyltransferase
VTERAAELVRDLVRDVPDFPKPGIIFKDLTPVFEHADTLRTMVGAFADRYADRGIDAVVGIESRGFLLAVPLALALGCGTVLVRKPGKLPRKTRARRYALEYGEDELHVHEDALRAGQRVVIVDDLLATGGTMRAACDLVEHAGAAVDEAACIIELEFLKGRDRVAPADCWSLVRY